MAAAPNNQITLLLDAARDGDQSASAQLLPMVYDNLRGLARSVFGRPAGVQTLEPTALVHEAWMKMVGQVDRINDRHHFFAIAAQAMRHVLADQARARAAQKRGGSRHRVTFIDDMAAAESTELDLIDLHDALNCGFLADSR